MGWQEVDKLAEGRQAGWKKADRQTADRLAEGRQVDGRTEEVGLAEGRQAGGK